MDELVAALNAAPPYRMIQLDAGGRFEGSNPITIEKAVALVGVDGRARISIATEKVGIVVKAPAYFENAEIHATLSPRGDAISAHDQCVLDHCQVSVTCRREGTQGIDAVFVHRSQLFANECHLATLVGPGRVRVVGGHVARATVSGHYEDVDLGELASSHRREITVSCGAIKKLYAGEGRVRIVGTAAIQNITVDDDANIWLEACTVGEDPNARYAMSVNAHLYYDAACKFGPNRENKLADFAYGARAWEMADALIEEQEP
jgi:hypothetical protein